MRVAAERCLALLFLACASCSTGCSLIGLGIGAAVPRWEHNVPPEKIESYRVEGKPLDVDVQLHELQWVAVRVAYEPHEVGPGRRQDLVLAPTHVLGSYGGLAHSEQSRELVLVTDEGNTRRVAVQDIERVDVRTGSYWATGLGVGVALDLAAALVTTVLMTTVAYVR